MLRVAARGRIKTPVFYPTTSLFEITSDVRLPSSLSVWQGGGVCAKLQTPKR
eukprot:IDg21370t1